MGLFIHYYWDLEAARKWRGRSTRVVNADRGGGGEGGGWHADPSASEQQQQQHGSRAFKWKQHQKHRTAPAAHGTGDDRTAPHEHEGGAVARSLPTDDGTNRSPQPKPTAHHVLLYLLGVPNSGRGLKYGKVFPFLYYYIILQQKIW